MRAFDRFRRGVRVAPALSRALTSDEAIVAHASSLEGLELAVTRRRLIMLAPEPEGVDPFSLPWWRIARAVWGGSALTLTPLRQVGELPDGGVVMVDDDPLRVTFANGNRLTDQVHHRVRRSVVGSRHLPWPGAGGWVSLRRVAGQDGLTTQLRLDPGADPDAPGFVDAALRVDAELRGTQAPGVTGVDE